MYPLDICPSLFLDRRKELRMRRILMVKGEKEIMDFVSDHFPGEMREFQATTARSRSRCAFPLL